MARLNHIVDTRIIVTSATDPASPEHKEGYPFCATSFVLNDDSVWIEGVTIYYPNYQSFYEAKERLLSSGYRI